MVELKVCNLTYSYNDRLSWQINNNFIGGKTYQIVGENGTGKSTIARLLTGIETNYDGNIYVNGTNIDRFSNIEKRNTFFCVSQEPYWSFIGDNFHANMKYFNMSAELAASISEEEIHKHIDSLKYQPVFSLSSEDVYLLSFYEAMVWERPIIFIDECPDFEAAIYKNFLIKLLKSRNTKKLITFISSHIRIDLPDVYSQLIQINEFTKNV